MGSTGRGAAELLICDGTDAAVRVLTAQGLFSAKDRNPVPAGILRGIHGPIGAGDKIGQQLVVALSIAAFQGVADTKAGGYPDRPPFRGELGLLESGCGASRPQPRPSTPGSPAAGR